MNNLSRSLAVLALVTLASSTLAAQHTAVSPFAGSTLIGQHQSRFGTLPVLAEPMDAQKVPKRIDQEGELDSRVFQRPKDVSALEVTRSYAQALEAAGFEIMLTCEQSRNNCKTSYIISSNYHRLLKARNYPSLPRDSMTWLAFNAHHYVSARKETGTEDIYAVVIVSDKNSLYSVDTIRVASMATGSVQITSKMMNDKLTSEGKVVLRGLFFETGSNRITAQSEPALRTIATYLKERATQSFYVVGHTDDTGDVSQNLALSSKRAQAVVSALGQLGANADKLSSHGVGPFAPAASNSSASGKASNRRVELVLRVK
jgi:outer membrane protein OmpA-like peptidoglycan-associated protein